MDGGAEPCCRGDLPGDGEEIKESVRQRYAQLISSRKGGGSCCNTGEAASVTSLLGYGETELKF